MESPPGAEVVIDGRRYFYFAGTSYLALHGHPEVIEAGVAALRRHGVHSATTRAGFGNTAPVLEVERRAAELFGTEEAFYLASGYAANHVLVQGLARQADSLFVEDSAHYCVLEAAKLAGLPCQFFRGRDAGDLERRLRARLRPGQRPLVMGDAVAPPTGELAPARDYLAVLSRFAPAVLLLDDAHGFGVVGGCGRGALEHWDCWGRVNGHAGDDGITLAVGGTAAKGLGGFGGLIPGSAAFIARARQASHWHDGASAPAAAVAGSTAKALELVARDPSLRERARANSARLRAGLRALGIEAGDSPAAHLGVAIGGADNMQRLHGALRERGILVPYVGAYSGTGAEGLLRFAVCSAHTPGMIDHLLESLAELL